MEEGGIPSLWATDSTCIVVGCHGAMLIARISSSLTVVIPATVERAMETISAGLEEEERPRYRVRQKELLREETKQSASNDELRSPLAVLHIALAADDDPTHVWFGGWKRLEPVDLRCLGWGA